MSQQSSSLFLNASNSADSLSLSPGILSYLHKEGLIDGTIMTVTGKTLAENLAAWDVKYAHKWVGQDVIRPLSNPMKSSGHIRSVFLSSSFPYFFH